MKFYSYKYEYLFKLGLLSTIMMCGVGKFLFQIHRKIPEYPRKGTAGMAHIKKP